MSVQTGEEIPAGPASSRPLDRAWYRLALLKRDPNPIWVRELRQSARLTRTPLILMTIAILVTLVVAALGGTMSSRESADRVGTAVYHTYFSLAFFLVTLVGPGIAANGIASEREGRTWEAMALTRLAPADIARGKFLASLTFISTYIVMLAPIGALAFLFGGVSATEVVIAFAYLFAFAVLFVSLGLAISSKMQSLRASILVTLLLIVPLSLGAYGFFGISVSEGVHELWAQVPQKVPVWLPTAYVRGTFGHPYVLLLIVMPIVLVVLPSWFFYETTVANLKDANDDRTTGLRRWFVVATPIIAGAAIYADLIVTSSAIEPMSILGLGALALYLTLMVMVFLGEPLAASRRVDAHFGPGSRGPLGFLLGPAFTRAMIVTLVFGAIFVVAQGATALSLLDASKGAGFGALLSYTIAFFTFVVGFASWLRARASSIFAARVLFVAALAGISIVPWVIGAVAGIFAQRADDSLFIASPSPFYAFYMYDAMKRSGQETNIGAGWVAMVGWAVLGLVLLLSGARKSRDIVERWRNAQNESEARLATEDRQREAASAPAE